MQVLALKNQLKKQSTATGDGVARAFLRAQVALFVDCGELARVSWSQ
ncbi:DENN domain-containing protein 1B, partial [Ophiophagus hannah]